MEVKCELFKAIFSLNTQRRVTTRERCNQSLFYSDDCKTLFKYKICTEHKIETTLIPNECLAFFCAVL